MNLLSKLVITLAFACAAFGQTAASPVPWINVQFTDQAGRALALGNVYSCPSGSACPGTQQATFTTSSMVTANLNPIRLDAAGRASIWLTPGVGYKFVVTDFTGAVVAGAGGDNIFGAASSSSGGGGGGGGTPGGSSTQIQFNTAGAFDADGNFTWNRSTKLLNVAGNPGTPAINVVGGFITSGGGFFSAVPGGSWAGFNTSTDGAILRGLNIGQNVGNNGGGYLNLGPITYNPYNGGACTDIYGDAVQQPLPLNGLSNFGTHTAVLWVGTSPIVPADGSCGGPPLPVDLDYGLNLNTYFFARGGLATDQNFFNSIQALQGGIIGQSLTAGRAYPPGTVTTTGTLTDFTYLGGYIAIGHSVGPPAAGTIATVTNPLTVNGGLEAGTMYWDDNLHCVNVYSDGGSWACLAGGGGGGTPGGPATAVQFNSNPSGAFSGSANFEWDNTNHLLNITALDATHPGISVHTGFISSDTGYLASGAAVNYNAIQAPAGGMYALSFTALNYVETGNHSGAPPATTADVTFPNAGTIYCDTGTSPCVEKLWNGSAWVTLATGGATSPGGSDSNVQYNSGGSFAGSANLTWCETIAGSCTHARLLNVITADATVTGMNVKNGFMSSDAGFVANLTTATSYNAIQAPGGGFAGLSGTFVNYIQPGQFNSGGGAGTPTLTLHDSFQPGAISWDTFGGGSLKYFNGTNWVPFGSGGGGAPGSPLNSIQFNLAGSFTGSSNLLWQSGAQDLQITTIANSVGLHVINGYAQADTGFNASIGTATLFNAVQAQGGGMLAKSFTAINYLNGGHSNGIPALTSGDSFNKGALYWDDTAAAEKVFNGSTWLSLATGGIPTLNGLSGALTIVGTTNRVTVSSVGTTITLSGPQDLGTSNNPTFASVTANGGFVALATGASLGFQGSGDAFHATGAGDIKGNSLTLNVGSGSALNVASDTSTASIQTVGGVNVGSTGSSNGVYQLNGSTIINATGTYLGNISTPPSSNSIFYVGGSGNFYNRLTTADPTITSCTGVGGANDSWTAINSFGGNAYVIVCIAGFRYRTQLFPF